MHAQNIEKYFFQPGQELVNQGVHNPYAAPKGVRTMAEKNALTATSGEIHAKETSHAPEIQHQENSFPNCRYSSAGT